MTDPSVLAGGDDSEVSTLEQAQALGLSVVTVLCAARILGVSEGRIRQMTQPGGRKKNLPPTLHATRVGNRTLQITVESIAFRLANPITEKGVVGQRRHRALYPSIATEETEA